MKIFTRDLLVTSFNPAPKKYRHLTPEQKIKEEEKKQQRRGRIKKFSFGSIKRLRFLLRNTSDKMEYEAGLTYPNEFPNDGLLVKEHFHMLLNKEIKEEVLAKMWFKK